MFLGLVPYLRLVRLVDCILGRPHGCAIGSGFVLVPLVQWVRF